VIATPKSIRLSVDIVEKVSKAEHCTHNLESSLFFDGFAWNSRNVANFCVEEKSENLVPEPDLKKMKVQPMTSGSANSGLKFQDQLYEHE
jgi:hypothetical protein